MGWAGWAGAWVQSLALGPESQGPLLRSRTAGYWGPSPLPGVALPGLWKARPTPGCEEGTHTFQQGSSLASAGKKGVEHISGCLGSTNQYWSPRGPV